MNNKNNKKEVNSIVDAVVGRLLLIGFIIFGTVELVNTFKNATTDTSPLKEVADRSEAEFNRIRLAK
jgi:hypothetical protein